MLDYGSFDVLLSEDPLSLIAKISRGEVDLARALELEPAILERLVERARGMIAHHKRDEGIALLEQLAKVCNRTASLPFMLGAALDEGGDHQRAHAAYDQAITRAIKNGDAALLQKARFCLGRNAIALDRLSAARTELERAESGPDPEISRVSSLIRARLEVVE